MICGQCGAETYRAKKRADGPWIGDCCTSVPLFRDSLTPGHIKHIKSRRLNPDGTVQIGKKQYGGRMSLHTS